MASIPSLKLPKHSDLSRDDEVKQIEIDQQKRGLLERGSGIKRRGSGSRVGKKDSGERMMRKLADFSSTSSSSPKGFEIQKIFSISPRCKTEDLQNLISRIQEFWKSEYPQNTYPPVLSYLLSQTAMNQFVFVSPDGFVLAHALKNENLFDLFFSAVESLTFQKEEKISSHTFLSDLQSRRILEMALKVITQSQSATNINIEKLKSLTTPIFNSPLLKHLTPRMNALYVQAQNAIAFAGIGNRETGASKTISGEGLLLINRMIVLEEQKAELRKMVLERNSQDPFSVQKTFLVAVREFILLNHKQQEFDPYQKDQVFQWSLQLICSEECEDLLNILKVKKIADLIVEHCLKDGSSIDAQELAMRAYRVMRTPSLSLWQLDFLLFWIQSDMSDEESTQVRVAGLREEDSQGALFQFIVDRILEMLKNSNRDVEVLNRMLMFTLIYSESPVNSDLFSSITIKQLWNRLKKELSAPDVVQHIDIPLYRALMKPKEEVNEATSVSLILRASRSSSFGSEKSLISILDINHWQPEIDDSIIKKIRSKEKEEEGSIRVGFNLVHQQPILWKHVPNMPKSFWMESSIAEHIAHGMIRYQLDSQMKISVGDFVDFPHLKKNSVLEQAKRNNQTVQLFVGQILASRNKEEAKGIVRVLLTVHKILVKVQAYEPAMCIQTVFNQAAINWIRGAFSDLTSYSEISSIDLFSPKDNFSVLRKEIAMHPHAWVPSFLFYKDMEFLRKISVYTQQKQEAEPSSNAGFLEGAVNLDRLEKIGKKLIQLVDNQKAVYEFWTSPEQNLSFNQTILDAFMLQSGVINDDCENDWWERAVKIHPKGSKDYWVFDEA